MFARFDVAFTHPADPSGTSTSTAPASAWLEPDPSAGFASATPVSAVPVPASVFSVGDES
jgi:hypothetical protein